MSLYESLPISIIFSENQLLVSMVIFLAIVVFIPISFISAPIFLISFLLLTLCFVSSFSSCFRCKVRFFFSLFFY